MWDLAWRRESILDIAVEKTHEDDTWRHCCWSMVKWKLSNWVYTVNCVKSKMVTLPTCSTSHTVPRCIFPDADMKYAWQSSLVVHGYLSPSFIIITPPPSSALSSPSSALFITQTLRDVLLHVYHRSSHLLQSSSLRNVAVANQS